jgi:hypothetical protein
LDICAFGGLWIAQTTTSTTTTAHIEKLEENTKEILHLHAHDGLLLWWKIAHDCDMSDRKIKKD